MGSHQSSLVRLTLTNISNNSYNRNRQYRSSDQNSLSGCCSSSKLRRHTYKNLLKHDHRRFFILF